MTSKKFFEKNPKIHEYVNRVVLNLVSSGVFNEKMNGVLNKSMECKVCKQDYSNIMSNIKAFPFELIEVKKLLYVFVSLSLISIFVFCVEFMPKFRRNKCRNNSVLIIDPAHILIPGKISINKEMNCLNIEAP